MAFLGLLTVGFCYEYGKKALNFTDHRSAISQPTIMLTPFMIFSVLDPSEARILQGKSLLNYLPE